MRRLLVVLASVTLFAGCDNILSPTIINNQNQGQSSNGSPSPSPSPSCVTASVSLTPASGTTDELVSPGTVVTFDVAILDSNGVAVPAVCLGPVSVSASGGCSKQADEPPTVLFEGPNPCAVCATHASKTGCYTLQQAP